MAVVYGVDWASLAEPRPYLDPLEAPVAPGAAAPVGVAGVPLLSVGQPLMVALTDRAAEPLDAASAVGSDFAMGSWGELSVEELRRRMLRDFDPGTQTAEEWVGTTLRAFECLVVRGESTGGFHATIPQRAIRARYEQEIFGQTPRRQPECSAGTWLR